MLKNYTPHLQQADALQPAPVLGRLLLSSPLQLANFKQIAKLSGGHKRCLPRHALLPQFAGFSFAVEHIFSPKKSRKFLQKCSRKFLQRVAQSLPCTEVMLCVPCNVFFSNFRGGFNRTSASSKIKNVKSNFRSPQIKNFSL
jgi:hypothetical protein